MVVVDLEMQGGEADLDEMVVTMALEDSVDHRLVKGLVVGVTADKMMFKILDSILVVEVEALVVLALMSSHNSNINNNIRPLLSHLLLLLHYLLKLHPLSHLLRLTSKRKRRQLLDLLLNKKQRKKRSARLLSCRL